MAISPINQQKTSAHPLVCSVQTMKTGSGHCGCGWLCGSHIYLASPFVQHYILRVCMCRMILCQIWASTIVSIQSAIMLFAPCWKYALAQIIWHNQQVNMQKNLWVLFTTVCRTDPTQEGVVSSNCGLYNWPDIRWSGILKLWSAYQARHKRTWCPQTMVCISGKT